MFVQSSKTSLKAAARLQEVGTMRNMTNAETKQETRRMEADREELADRIAAALPRDGKVEPQPGLVFTRFSSPTEPVHAVLEPWLCMIAQGAKDVLLGDEQFRYDPAHYLVSTLGVPAIGRVVGGIT
jgi:hypothetical protein